MSTPSVESVESVESVQPARTVLRAIVVEISEIGEVLERLFTNVTEGGFTGLSNDVRHDMYRGTISCLAATVAYIAHMTERFAKLPIQDDNYANVQVAREMLLFNLNGIVSCFDRYKDNPSVELSPAMLEYIIARFKSFQDKFTKTMKAPLLVVDTDF
jgi:hypothetical protein